MKIAPKTRLIYKRDGIDKYWTLAFAGKQVDIHFGKGGTPGQKQIKQFANPAAARQYAEKQIWKKMFDGYQKATKAAPAATPAAAAKPAAPKHKLASAPVSQKTKQEVRKALADLWQMMDEHRKSDTYYQKMPTKPGKPASAAAIATLEKKLGIALPPSYRAFLEQCDGCAHLSYDWHFFALKDLTPTGKLKAVIDQWKSNEKLGNVLCIARREDQPDWLYLDPATQRKDGEMDVVYCDHESGNRSYPSLTAFIKRRQEYQKLLMKPDRKKARSSAK